MTIVTCRAYRARWSAAWPAEFAPPTMNAMRTGHRHRLRVEAAVEDPAPTIASIDGTPSRW